MEFESIAIILQIGSSLFAAMTAMLLKLIQELNFNQTLYLRGISSFILLILIINHYKTQVQGFDKQTMKTLIERGLLASFGAFLYFQGLDLVLVSESIILNRMSPIWTSIIQILILKKEQFNRRLCLNMLLCSVGIYLVAKNNTNKNQANNVEDGYYHNLGIILICLASISQAFVNILIQQINKEVDNLAICIYQSFFATIFPSVISLTKGSKFIFPSQYEAFLIIMISVMSLFSGQLSVSAMRQGKLSVISNVSQIQIFFGYLIDVFIFKVQFNGEQILGNILLLCSLIPLIWK
ncbi:unnamed protein product [Paramecium sonneborni]|uniref:EamA domain-containing protein n=1 Tax=Paramecium sonneborni TaxID=65129 RepID=A0A8S1QU20_9CILI|nr:unnamed protein product [Paramecium sonneborni]